MQPEARIVTVQFIKSSLPGHSARQRKMECGQESANEMLAHYVLDTILDYYNGLIDHWKGEYLIYQKQ